MYKIAIICPECAGDVSLVNSTTTGMLSVAIVGCAYCNTEFEITVRMRAHVDPDRERISKRRYMQRKRAKIS